MMARFWLFTGVFLSLAVYTLSFDHSQITVFPKDDTKAGVFMVSYRSGGINASRARDLCLFMDAAIATMAQMETALQHGLETCTYGWIDGDMLVVPRIERSSRCGANKTGLVTWNASPNRVDAYCFKSDLQKPLDTTTPADIKSQGRSTTTTTITTTTPPLTATVTHLFKSIPKVFRKSTTGVWKTSLTTSTVPVPLKSTLSSSSTFTSTPSPSRSSPPSPLSTIRPSHPLSTPSPSRSSPPSPLSTIRPSHPLSTSSPSLSRSASSTGLSVFSVSSSVSSTDLTVVSQPASSTGIGAIPMAFLVLATILLLLAVAAAVWHFKMNRRIFPFWSAKRQKEDIETEMWKPSDSEMELREQQREGEDNHRKYSSDITL